jgi:hypothetical protein
MLAGRGVLAGINQATDANMVAGSESSDTVGHPQLPIYSMIK